MVKHGLTNGEIGDRLGISKSYVRRLMAELSISRPKNRKADSSGWGKHGLRISNLAEEEIARLYGGARYGSSN